jgi:hypothetical protein
MARLTVDHDAEIAARGGGPPLPIPANLDDMGPILARWPLLLKYDPESGELWRRYIVETSPNPQYLDKRQYLATYVGGYNRQRNMARVDGFTVAAAKLVWLLHHGVWPQGRLKWKDGNTLNDRIENLEVEPATAPGTPGRARTRPVGVSRLHDRWQAYAPLPDGRRKHLGVHKTEADAIAARAKWDAAHDLV